MNNSSLYNNPHLLFRRVRKLRHPEVLRVRDGAPEIRTSGTDQGTHAPPCVTDVRL